MTERTHPKDRTLERHGFLRCTFGFEEGETCYGCDRKQREGARQYYERQCGEYDDGDYFCRCCAYDKAMGREYDARPFFKRSKPMHGAGWAYLHGMRNWEAIFWRAYLD